MIISESNTDNEFLDSLYENSYILIQNYLDKKYYLEIVKGSSSSKGMSPLEEWEVGQYLGGN